MGTTDTAGQGAGALESRARDLQKGNRWEELAALLTEIPETLDQSCLALADDVSFALGQLRRHRDAIALKQRAWDVEPSWRRASALAFLHYDAAMMAAHSRGSKGPRGACTLDREEARAGFRRWIEEALRLRPDSLKDLYRLGVFESQVESRRDNVALRVFMAAIESYRSLPAENRRGDLHKTFVKALYAAARSALRLRKPQLARRLAFACYREDEKTNYLDPLHRLDMAGRACLANGELDHADRAFRLALDAKGPPRRDYLYSRLADVARRRGELEESQRWIERNTRPERRAAWLWRQLGDIKREAQDLDGAIAAWEVARDKDRDGRHLTLTRLATAFAERGELGRAERTFKKAIDFARRRWAKDHRPAVEGLATVLRSRGKTELAERVLASPAKAGRGVEAQGRQSA